MFTAICSFLHFLVDGICAFAMFFGAAGMSMSQTGAVVYNCCAFALQFPIGVILDAYLAGKRDSLGLRRSALWAVIGFIITSFGALLILLDGISVRPGSDILAVVILGIGNAIFHIGGGVTAVAEDRQRDLRGALLGIFVAPGAVGLFLGRKLSDAAVSMIASPSNNVSSSDLGIMFILVIAAEVAMMSLLFFVTNKPRPQAAAAQMPAEERKPLTVNDLFIAIPCILVVILRSFAGFTISYADHGAILAFAGVMMLALGKAAGGIAGGSLGRYFGNRYKRLDVYYGYRIVTIASLIVSAVAFLFFGNAAADLISRFAFNMTMPITLYILCSRYSDHVGGMFGLLTLALFVGYLPTWSGYKGSLKGEFLGVIVSVVSLVLLMISFTYLWRDRKETSRDMQAPGREI